MIFFISNSHIIQFKRFKYICIYSIIKYLHFNKLIYNYFNKHKFISKSYFNLLKLNYKLNLKYFTF